MVNLEDVIEFMNELENDDTATNLSKNIGIKIKENLVDDKIELVNKVEISIELLNDAMSDIRNPYHIRVLLWRTFSYLEEIEKTL